MLVALAIFVVGLFLGLRWADEPRRRRIVLFDAPIRLENGQSVSGSFVPEHDGPYEIAIRFRRDRPLEEIGAAVGGDWFGRPGPPGFSVSYSIRDRDVVLRRGSTAEPFRGTFGSSAATVQVAWIDDGHPVPLAVEAQVDRAVPALAGLDSHLVVAESGDWASYAWLEAAVRTVLVVGAALIALIATLVVAAIRQSRRRRRAGPLKA